MNPRDKMVRARSELVLEHPFFATLALKLGLKEDCSCASAWTDGTALAFNPEYVRHMPLEKVVGMQAHEVMHLVCHHHLRRKGRDVGLWNKACDYAINSILLQAGLSLPTGYLDDPAYHGKSVDDIYATLSRLMDEEKGEGTGESANDAEDEADEGSGGSANGGLPFEKDTDAAQASSDGESAVDEDKKTRAAADNGDGEGMGQERDPGMSGEVRDHPDSDGGKNREALEKAERDMKVALGQALQQALNMEDLPQGLERLVNHSLRPQLDWQTLLRRFLQSCTANDYSWTPPNRRYIHMDLHLPSLRSQELPEIVLAVDTSGSVDKETLDIFCAEISSLLESFDTQLTLLLCDAAVQDVKKITRLDLPLSFDAKGGGGTDYRPVFEYIEEHGLHPACCIYMTDFECNRFPDPPGYPVLWVNSGRRMANPPFGDVLMLSGEEVCA
ncbi:MAG: DUF2201 family putative metallopeptidase [Desulfovibrio sp.]|uniref:vWA domain-containing protein n=1 Tax=Desulfovibrio sp. 7SRBS1 TaxID=3378064 RepID=UPI003B413245